MGAKRLEDRVAGILRRVEKELDVAGVWGWRGRGPGSGRLGGGAGCRCCLSRGPAAISGLTGRRPSPGSPARLPSCLPQLRPPPLRPAETQIGDKMRVLDLDQDGVVSWPVEGGWRALPVRGRVG